MKRPRNIKFFIVFKDSFSRMLYHQYLVKLGYRNNILIEDGEDCLKKLDLEPDAVFMDYEMQPQSGMEVLQKIKEHNPAIQVVLFSCPKLKQVNASAILHGALACIPKGDNDLEMLRKSVEKIVSGMSRNNQPEVA